MKIQSLTPRHRGFTLVELLVVMLIVVVLATLTFVSVNRVRDSTRRAASMGNLRQLGIAMTTFTVENNGYLPVTRMGSTYWPQVIYPYIGNADVFVRPGTKKVPVSAQEPEGYFDISPEAAKTPEGVPIRWNYVINGGASTLPFSEDPKNNPKFTSGLSRTLSTLQQPERTIFMTEGASAFWINGEAKPDSNRIYRWKNGTANILFGDGSTRAMNPKTEITANSFLVIKK